MDVFEFNKINGYMDLFKGQNLLEFAKRFQSDEDCIKYSSHFK